MSMVEDAGVMDPTMWGAESVAPEAEGRRREEARGHIDGTGWLQLPLRRKLGIQFSSCCRCRAGGCLRGRGFVVRVSTSASGGCGGIFWLDIPLGASLLPWRLSSLLSIAVGIRYFRDNQ
jgi:hypothetical protein